MSKSNIISRRKKFRIFCLILFIIYILLIIYLLVRSEIYGRSEFSTYRYNLEPFLEIKRFIWLVSEGDPNRYWLAFANLVGNIIGFVPFGALLRYVRNKHTGFFSTMMFTFLFSLAIEVVQLVTKMGVFDVDDLLLNTLGGVLGYGIYRWLRYVDRRKHGIQGK